MKIGDWVIIHSSSTSYDEREGRIVKFDGANCYVLLDETRYRVAKRYLRKIRKDINYAELLNQALQPLDEEWAKEISKKMKEVKT